MTDPAWEEYLATAQRLNTVRQEAAAVVAERAAAMQAARQELASVRARLAAQQARLRNAASLAGAVAPELAPAPAEVDNAARAMGDSPAAVLDTLRRGRLIVDEADAAVVAAQSPGTGPAGWPPPLRNLLVYGPLALLVLIGQMILYSVVSETSLPLTAPLCGLVMPAVAFGVGFVLIGLLFPAPPGAQVDRTPILGAAVCLASVLVLCAGIGLLAALR